MMDAATHKIVKILVFIVVVYVTAISLLSSSGIAGEPLSKEDWLAESLGRADACFDFQIPKLDDGLSPANVIAEAVVVACKSYIDNIISIQIQHKSYYYKRDYPAIQFEESKQKVMISVLQHRTGK